MGKFAVLKNLIRLIASILLSIAFVMTFLNQVEITGIGKLNFIDTFFGENGSFSPLIGYALLMICASVCFAFININMLEERKRFVYYIIAAVLIIAALLIFAEGAIITISINQEGTKAHLLAPPIIAGVIAVISSLGLSFAELSTKHQEKI